MMTRILLILSLLVFTAACSGDDDQSTENNGTSCAGLACEDAGSEDMGDSSDAANNGVADLGMDEEDLGMDTGPELPTLSATGNNEADVLYGWVAAGQPSEARVEEVVATGATIISLRLPSEDPFAEEALVTSLGGTFIRYPTTASSYSTQSFREDMYDLYDAQLDAGNIVYLHCASSNRVGASWALYQAERKGVAPEMAVEMGRAAGLSGLESTVRGLLGI